jgi:hypothetical protein
MQREEKVLDAATEALALRVNDLKAAIAQVIVKLELESDSLKWPSLLDSFGVLTSEVTFSFYFFR